MPDPIFFFLHRIGLLLNYKGTSMNLIDEIDSRAASKNLEIETQLLCRMYDVYGHVKQYGIDRTFVSLYNRNGELDRICGMQLPGCESFATTGDRYDKYTTSFLAAMEDEKTGIWARIKNAASKVWGKILEAGGVQATGKDKKDLAMLVTQLKKVHQPNDVVTCSGAAAKIISDKTVGDALFDTFKIQYKKTMELDRLFKSLVDILWKSKFWDQMYPEGGVVYPNMTYPYTPVLLSDEIANKLNYLLVRTNTAVTEYKKLAKNTQACFKKAMASAKVQVTAAELISEATRFHSKADQMSHMIRTVMDSVSSSAKYASLIAAKLSSKTSNYKYGMAGVACMKLTTDCVMLVNSVDNLRDAVLRSMFSVRNLIAKAAGVKYKW